MAFTTDAIFQPSLSMTIRVGYGNGGYYYYGMDRTLGEILSDLQSKFDCDSFTSGSTAKSHSSVSPVEYGYFNFYAFKVGTRDSYYVGDNRMDSSAGSTSQKLFIQKPNNENIYKGNIYYDSNKNPVKNTSSWYWNTKTINSRIYYEEPGQDSSWQSGNAQPLICYIGGDVNVLYINNSIYIPRAYTSKPSISGSMGTFDLVQTNPSDISDGSARSGKSVSVFTSFPKSARVSTLVNRLF